MDFKQLTQRVSDRATEFLSRVSPVIQDAAGNSVSQMSAAARHAQQTAGSFFEQVGTATGAALSGTPTPTTYYGKTNVVASQGGITPGGILGSVGLKDAASKVQAAYQDPRIAQMIGAGVIGTGALGLGLAGASAVSAITNRQKNRMAGEKLEQN